MATHTFQDTTEHLLTHVLDAAAEYESAEAELSAAQAAGVWDRAGAIAKRKAAEVAVAIDSLADRASQESGQKIDVVRADVAALCFWPGTSTVRDRAFERVHGVANAYKHDILKARHVLGSFEDVLPLGLGFGLDGFGVGKAGGVEVLVREKSGEQWKFLGDVPTVLSAWFRYLAARGALLPSGPIMFRGVQVYP